MSARHTPADAADGSHSSDVTDVPVPGEIRLGQFLKYAGLVDSGADARELVAEGDVLVDGEVETRRGRQLGDGEIVTVDTAEERVVVRVVRETS